MNRIGLGLALVLVAGCNANVNGTIGGQPVSTPDATYRTDSTTIPFFGTFTTTTVVLGGKGGALCEDLANGIQRAGSESLTFVFNGGVTKGEWIVGGSTEKNRVHVTVRRLDLTCKGLLTETAGSGKVIVDAIDGNVRATFDLGFGGDRLTGSFNAANCVTPFTVAKNCL